MRRDRTFTSREGIINYAQLALAVIELEFANVTASRQITKLADGTVVYRPPFCQEEKPARTLGVLNAVRYKYRFSVKNTHINDAKSWNRRCSLGRVLHNLFRGNFTHRIIADKTLADSFEDLVKGYVSGALSVYSVDQWAGHRQTIDITFLPQLAPPHTYRRLDREAVDLQLKLETMQESVIALMDKKEVLESTRHTTLVKCLEEVNGALGAIYRRLTSVEGATIKKRRRISLDFNLGGFKAEQKILPMYGSKFRDINGKPKMLCGGGSEREKGSFPCIVRDFAISTKVAELIVSP